MWWEVWAGGAAAHVPSLLKTEAEDLNPQDTRLTVQRLRKPRPRSGQNARGAPAASAGLAGLLRTQGLPSRQAELAGRALGRWSCL